MPGPNLTTSYQSVKLRTSIWSAFFIAMLHIGGSGMLRSQSAVPDSAWLSGQWYYSDTSASFIDAVEFLPRFFRDEALLKRYLRDERFFALRKIYDDTLAVDAIFDRAMMITQGNIGRALLISAVSVMDHRRLGFKVPLVGSVYLPLTAENDSLFRLRRTHLPKKLLDDDLRASDKDKLQHFFGSAYLAYTTNSRVFSEFIGDLFETGEDRFVLGGRSDPRDQLANAKGREFGLGLLKDAALLPSDVLWNLP